MDHCCWYSEELKESSRDVSTLGCEQLMAGNGRRGLNLLYAALVVSLNVPAFSLGHQTLRSSLSTRLVSYTSIHTSRDSRLDPVALVLPKSTVHFARRKIEHDLTEH